MNDVEVPYGKKIATEDIIGAIIWISFIIGFILLVMNLYKPNIWFNVGFILFIFSSMRILLFSAEFLATQKADKGDLILSIIVFAVGIVCTPLIVISMITENRFEACGIPAGFIIMAILGGISLRRQLRNKYI